MLFIAIERQDTVITKNLIVHKLINVVAYVLVAKSIKWFSDPT